MTAEQSPHRLVDPLRSNRMLSSSEEAVIRSSYWETNSSISRLEAQINDLQLRRHALCNHRQMLATLLSPVRRLPPELLGEIFHHCLPQDYQEKGAHNAVMLPSHVCKHWRDVALSIPILWTNIVLHVTNETFKSQTALVTTWFSRSGVSPLSFTLEGRENVRPILAFLLQYCNRWQYINLSVPLETLRSLEVAKGHLQRLETMRINGVSGRMPYSVEHVFESAPRLRKVSSSFRLVRNGRCVSWSHLVELDARFVSYTVEDCLALLRSMKNLQKLKICVDSGTGVEEGHCRFAFSHPLVSLDVLGTGARILFDHITLPSLRELIADEIDCEWLCRFTSLLERSSPPLQSFSVGFPMDVGDIWEDNLTQVLHHIPSLRSLCLVYNWCEAGGGSFVERLRPRMLDNGQVHCSIPKLNTISIQLGCQLITPDYEALKDMVVSRCSLAHSTNAGDNISGPIERFQKVEVRCTYHDFLNSADDTMWHEEVSEILAPLQDIVDMVQVVIQ
jgi:hypothetical protein